MRRAVVTGSQGFLGRHVVHGLRQLGVAVTTLARLDGPGPSHIAMGAAPWSATRLATIIEAAQPDAIFHLAGGAVGSAAELEQLNVGIATAIMQALRDAKPRPLLICCGSAAEYGTAIIDGVPVCEMAQCAPTSAYGVSKLAQTTAALEFAKTTGTPVLIARIFNPIGPGIPTYLALGDFARQLSALGDLDGTLATGNLKLFRDFIDIEHVVTMLWQLATNPAARGVVNICSGEATELSGLVAILIELSGKKVRLETLPSRLRPGEPRVVLGSTALLTKLGARPPRTDYPNVLARIWQAAVSYQAGAS